MNEGSGVSVKPRPSLLDGVENAVCQSLCIRNVRHRSALHALKVNDGHDLPRVVYRVVADAWESMCAAENINRSRRNWRWSLQPQIGAANRSPEVVLERAIALACMNAGRSDWANQIPIASGLVTGAAGGRRAIDLAQRRGGRAYEFIELKIASDTPLYATVELLGYASLWLLARREPPTHHPELLDAEHIDLRVLAPAVFYSRFKLAELEQSVDRGIQSLGREQSVALTFGFDILPEQLESFPLLDEATLMDVLADRRRLHCG